MDHKKEPNDSDSIRKAALEQMNRTQGDLDLDLGPDVPAKVKESLEKALSFSNLRLRSLATIEELEVKIAQLKKDGKPTELDEEELEIAIYNKDKAELELRKHLLDEDVANLLSRTGQTIEDLLPPRAQVISLNELKDFLRGAIETADTKVVKDGLLMQVHKGDIIFSAELKSEGHGPKIFITADILLEHNSFSLQNEVISGGPANATFETYLPSLPNIIKNYINKKTGAEISRLKIDGDELLVSLTPSLVDPEPKVDPTPAKVTAPTLPDSPANAGVDPKENKGAPQERRKSERLGPPGEWSKEDKPKNMIDVILDLEQKLLNSDAATAQTIAKLLEVWRDYLKGALTEAGESLDSKRWDKTKSIPQEIELRERFDIREKEKWAREAEMARKNGTHGPEGIEKKESEDATKDVAVANTLVSKEVKARAEKFQKMLGVKSKEFVEKLERTVDSFGQKYNALPLKYKLAIAAGLVTAGTGGAAFAGYSLAVAIASTAGLTKGAIGWASSYAAFKKVIEINKNTGFTKKGRAKIERGEKNIYWLTENPKAWAAIMSSSLVLGSFFASHLLIASEREFGSMSETPEAKKVIDNFVAKNWPPLPTEPTPMISEMPSPYADSAPPTVEIETSKGALTLPDYEVKKGDTLYRILRENFSDIDKLPLGGRQTNAIENVLEQMRKSPRDFGISSGNVNQLKIGEEINLQKIKEILETHQVRGENIIERAQNLPEAAVKNIENFTPEPRVTLDSQPVKFTETNIENSDSLVKVGDSSDFPTREHPNIGDQLSEETVPLDDAWERVQKYFYVDPSDANSNLDRQTAVIVETARSAYISKLDELFGTKGLFGFGKVSGIDSSSWNSLKNLTTEDLTRIKNPLPDFLKLQTFVATLGEQSSIFPEPREKVENYVQKVFFTLAKKGVIQVT